MARRRCSCGPPPASPGFRLPSWRPSAAKRSPPFAKAWRTTCATRISRSSRATTPANTASGSYRHALPRSSSMTSVRRFRSAAFTSSTASRCRCRAWWGAAGLSRCWSRKCPKRSDTASKRARRPCGGRLRTRAGPSGPLQMRDSPSSLGRTAADFHRRMKANADAVGTLLVDAFHNLALFAIGATTVWSGATAFFGMVEKGRAQLSDLLLLFIYLEIGAMIGIYFKTTELPVRYLIYIAITALGRVLIEVVSAEHRTGTDLLILTGAILVLSLAALVLRIASGRHSPSVIPDGELGYIENEQTSRMNQN